MVWNIETNLSTTQERLMEINFQFKLLLLKNQQNEYFSSSLMMVKNAFHWYIICVRRFKRFLYCSSSSILYAISVIVSASVNSIRIFFKMFLTCTYLKCLSLVRISRFCFIIITAFDKIGRLVLVRIKISVSIFSNNIIWLYISNSYRFFCC